MLTETGKTLSILMSREQYGHAVRLAAMKRLLAHIEDLGPIAEGLPDNALLEARDILGSVSALSRAVVENEDCRRVAYVGVEGRVWRRRFTEAERSRAVVDLNNALWTLSGRDAPKQVALLEALIKRLRSLGVDFVAGVADANLADDGQDIEPLKALLSSFHQSERGKQADELILDMAEKHSAFIVSNDKYKQYRKASHWRRRNIWRLLVPVEVQSDGTFHLGSAEDELRSPL